MSKQTRKEIESILAKRESKKQRVQLLLEPSLYEYVQEMAWENRISANLLIRYCILYALKEWDERLPSGTKYAACGKIDKIIEELQTIKEDIDNA